MVPSDVVKSWLEPDIFARDDLPLLNAKELAKFFAVKDPIVDLGYITTEDDNPPPGVGGWINHLILCAPLPMPDLGEGWNLLAGGLNDPTEKLPYVLYVAGQGCFDSSFPLLIFRAKDAKVMVSYGLQWVAATPPEDLF